MNGTLGPRAGLPPGTGLPLTLLAACWGTAGALGLLWVCGASASWLTGHGFTGPPFDTRLPRRVLTEGATGLWPGTPPGIVYGLAVLVMVVVGVPAVAAVTGWRARHPAGAGGASLAGVGDVRALTALTVTTRARALRPSLARIPPKHLKPSETGIALGRLAPRGPVLRASWEDVILAVMAPRAGKTTSLAVPAVLDAPGCVLATSNKADLYTATASLREQDTTYPITVFDPQNITVSYRRMWWNPLDTATTVEEASRLAGHFIQEVRGPKASGGGGNDFWTAAAHDLLTALILAAAVSDRSLNDVYEWLNDPAIPTPALLLREAGFDAVAASLTGRQHGAPETRDGVYETARTAAQCLRDPAITAWVTPPHTHVDNHDGRGRCDCTDKTWMMKPISVAGMISSPHTLYLLSKEGAGAAAPLVAALTDRFIREATRAAEAAGGRLDPPLTLVLDEAANICRIADLPDLYSHLGSRGITPITILQSYRQGVRVWGDAGMDTLWSAATIKVIGAGIDDPRLAEDLSRLIGDRDATVRSHNDSRRDRSVSTSLRRQRILPPEDIRALPRGTALLLATGTRAAMIRLLPWYAGPRAAEIAAVTATATAAISQRAAERDHREHG